MSYRFQQKHADKDTKKIVNTKSSIFVAVILFHVAKIVFFIDTAKFSGKKHRRAGECQGAKKNEEKDTKKRKPRLDFRFLFYSLILTEV